MQRLTIASTLTAAWLAGTPSFAHPGHGDAELIGTWLHHLVEPVHLPLKIAVLAAVGVVLHLLTRRRSA